MELYLSEEKIQDKIFELANFIVDDISKEKDIVALGVLNGSVHFYSDLVRNLYLLGIDCKVDFIDISSYTKNKEQGELIMNKKPTLDLKDKTVLIVEDIVDTGNTMTEICNYLKKIGVDNYKVCSLLTRSSCEFVVDYLGFEVEDDSWLVGYGCDNDGLERNRNHIYKL